MPSIVSGSFCKNAGKAPHWYSIQVSDTTMLPCKQMFRNTKNQAAKTDFNHYKYQTFKLADSIYTHQNM